MILYRIHYTDSDGSHGFAWFTSRAAARRAAAEYVRDNAAEPETGDVQADIYRRRIGVPRPEIEEVDFPLTKRGVLGLLNAYAAHAANG